jgi:hypothetical protein
MAAQLFHTAFHRAFTTAGVPASGEKLYFYLSGGTTPTPVYSDAGLTTPLSNPVVADSAGRFPAIYLDGAISYRVVQETAGGVEVNDVDPLAFEGSLDQSSVETIISDMIVGGDYVTVTPVGDTLVIDMDPDDSSPLEAVIVPIFDTPTAVAAGVGKFSFRMPYAFALSAVRASLATAQTSGTLVTVDINVTAVSILSTKLTIDNTEKTSESAATAPVLTSTPATIPDDAEVTFDVDTVGDGTAKGLNVTLVYRRVG